MFNLGDWSIHKLRRVVNSPSIQGLHDLIHIYGQFERQYLAIVLSLEIVRGGDAEIFPADGTDRVYIICLESII
jgi:hypothetical protein